MNHRVSPKWHCHLFQCIKASQSQQSAAMCMTTTIWFTTIVFAALTSLAEIELLSFPFLSSSPLISVLFSSLSFEECVLVVTLFVHCWMWREFKELYYSLSPQEPVRVLLFPAAYSRIKIWDTVCILMSLLNVEHWQCQSPGIYSFPLGPLTASTPADTPIWEDWYL